VGTKIHIVPHINDSGEIRMEIDEEISEVAEGGGGGGALGAVTINRRTAKTTVVVQDQNTIVIGGLTRNVDRESDDRIPILGDIPVLGALFRRTSRTTQHSNLLLVLTPHVIRDQSDLRRIFERKMRERQEFLDRYMVFTGRDYEPPTDFTRTNGLVEEIRQSLRELRTRAEFEAASRPRPPPPHTPSESIDLPVERRPSTIAPALPGVAGPALVTPQGLPGGAMPAPALTSPVAVPVGIPVPP
jgi:general secretion pathway protein D